MKRRTWPIALGIFVLMIGAWIFIGRDFYWPQFDAEEYRQIGEDSPWRVDVKFAGVNTVSWEGMAWDSLKLELDCPGLDTLEFDEETVVVDYWLMGRWYFVYGERHCYTVHHDGAGETEMRFPAGEFGRIGLYRVRLLRELPSGSVQEAGSCKFLVLCPTRAVWGAKENLFDHWQKVEAGSDYIDWDVTLTPTREFYAYGKDMLAFVMNNDPEDYDCDRDARIDMLWNGGWYTVSESVAVSLASTEETTWGAREIYAEIPRKVMRCPGIYRLYWGRVAYCEFTVEE